ncbi:MAG: hypothetical protein BJ554DRAFT_4027 [Olpidium bornovanus]|uniref:Uncharacterized protein n=1 Tax=Olpidium bornovanus TaxID=278681 RepID=A0A8H8A2J3_9FUNG|nr:MAG: hypothetical protein BJ554DRAFT_4027 [Olpidium bornovanus]
MADAFVTEEFGKRVPLPGFPSGTNADDGRETRENTAGAGEKVHGSDWPIQQTGLAAAGWEGGVEGLPRRPSTGAAAGSNAATGVAGGSLTHPRELENATCRSGCFFSRPRGSPEAVRSCMPGEVTPDYAGGRMFCVWNIAGARPPSTVAFCRPSRAAAIVNWRSGRRRPPSSPRDRRPTAGLAVFASFQPREPAVGTSVHYCTVPMRHQSSIVFDRAHPLRGQANRRPIRASTGTHRPHGLSPQANEEPLAEFILIDQAFRDVNSAFIRSFALSPQCPLSPLISADTSTFFNFTASSLGIRAFAGRVLAGASSSLGHRCPLSQPPTTSPISPERKRLIDCSENCRTLPAGQGLSPQADEKPLAEVYFLSTRPFVTLTLVNKVTSFDLPLAPWGSGRSQEERFWLGFESTAPFSIRLLMAAQLWEHCPLMTPRHLPRSPLSFEPTAYRVADLPRAGPIESASLIALRIVVRCQLASAATCLANL